MASIASDGVAIDNEEGKGSASTGELSTPTKAGSEKNLSDDGHGVAVKAEAVEPSTPHTPQTVRF